MVTEATLPPFNPYDPEQNQLLLLKPSWRNPILTLDRVKDFLNATASVVDASWEQVKIRSAMTKAEYISCYYWLCNNPSELSEPAFMNEIRQDFSIQVKSKYEPDTIIPTATSAPKVQP